VVFENYIKRITDYIWNYQVKKRYPIPNASHLSLQYDRIDMVLWNKEDVPDLLDKCTIPRFELLFNEWQNAENKKTVICPVQHEISYNILVDVGLVEIAKGYGTDDTPTNYIFGDSTTTAAAGDTALGNKVLAKAFSAEGDKGTTIASKTSKYLMPVTSVDYTGDIKEAGLATGTTPPSTGTLLTHYNFGTVTIASPSLLTAITTIVYKNGTVT